MRSESDPNLAPLGFALTVGLLSGTLYWAMFSVHHGSDFLVFHFASKAWLSGTNAYSIALPIMQGGSHLSLSHFTTRFRERRNGRRSPGCPCAWRARRSSASRVGCSRSVSLEPLRLGQRS